MVASAKSTKGHHHYQIFDKHASYTSVGPLPGSWLALRIADVTPNLQVFLSLGLTVVSFHQFLPCHFGRLIIAGSNK